MRAVSWSQFSTLETKDCVELVRKPAYGLYVSLVLLVFGFIIFAELSVFDFSMVIYFPPLLFIVVLVVVLHPPRKVTVLSLNKMSRILKSGAKTWSEPYRLLYEIHNDNTAEEYSIEIFVSDSSEDLLLFTVNQTKVGAALVDFAHLGSVDLFSRIANEKS